MIDNRKSWLLPSIADVFFVAVFLYFAIPPDKDMLLDGDTGYHIRAGEYILDTLSIPTVDLFSFITPTLPWTAHEWLSEVILALLHRLGGLTAVVIAFSCITAACVLVFYKIVRSEGNNILLSTAATVMFVALAKMHILARPHIFSLFILIVWYWLLNEFQYRHRNRLWTMPVIMLLWVNLHGGYVIGLALLGVYFAGNCHLLYSDKYQWDTSGRENARELGKALGLSMLVCLANPIGYHIFLFPFKLISSRFIMDHTGEFLSPNFHDPQPFKYLLLLLIVFLAYSRRKPNIIEIVLTVLFTSMSLYSVRYIPLLGVVVIPVILRYIERDSLSVFPGLERFVMQRVNNITLADSMAKGYLWPVASIFIISFLAVNGTVTHSFDPKIKPMAALEFLRDHPIAGNMFNNDEFGDCTIYALHKQYKVFIDGRGDMYGAEKFKEYFRITGFESGWDRVIEKYNITWIFFDTNSVLSRYLINQADWKLIYSDKVASIFVKNIPIHKALINKFYGVKLSGL
jgi:hypothetical protein